MSDGRTRSYDELLQAYATERSDPSFEPIRLGFGTIDAELRGISPGQVLVIAARTAVGKTWLLESIEHNVAARDDSGTLSLSLEMPGIEWAERAVAIAEGVAPEQVEAWAKQGTLAQNTQTFLERMQNTLVAEYVAPGETEAVIEEARERLQVPLRVLLIDYMGLLATAGRDSYERASQVALGLKRLAKKERLAIVVASQLSRAGGNGSEPVGLEMLRDSGVVEESADFILGCWRPEKKRDLTPDEYDESKDVLRVAVLKNRKGGEGRDVLLKFNEDSRMLYEPADPFAEWQ